MKIFEINPGLFIWSVITFLILVAVLYKYAFNPLMKLQKERQDEIHQSIVGAEQLRNEAQELLANYKRQMAEARHESEAILERARKLGETSKADILEEARVQAETTLARAREQIERDTSQALQKIREEVADLTIAATEKVTRKSLTAGDHLQLIQEAIDEIDLSKVSDN
ncbi:MAG TPA: F0F1 ATP synthase subunit B [Thermoleophilia bacterium]